MARDLSEGSWESFTEREEKDYLSSREFLLISIYLEKQN